MIIITPHVEIMDELDGAAILRKLERCGRVCYKSESRTGEDTAPAFVGGLIRRGHESVLEHVSVTVFFVIDRISSQSIVRHRIASYSQESTRYCNYGKEQFGGEITVVLPASINGSFAYDAWRESCEAAEQAYFEMLDIGLNPEDARAVLPVCVKTELVMTANLREWRHFFKLRASTHAHPELRAVTSKLLAEFQAAIPVVFDDLKGVA